MKVLEEWVDTSSFVGRCGAQCTFVDITETVFTTTLFPGSPCMCRHNFLRLLAGSTGRAQLLTFDVQETVFLVHFFREIVVFSTRYTLV